MLKSNFRKKEVFSKSVTKTLYGSKFLVSEYIFKLAYHCEGSRWSEIFCARTIAKSSLIRLLLLLILKSSYPRCTVEKGVKKRCKNFTNFKGKHLWWSLSLGQRISGPKKFQRSYFPVKFCKIFKNTYFEEHLWTTAYVFSCNFIYNAWKRYS